MTNEELDELIELIVKFDKAFCSPTKPFRSVQHDVVQFRLLVQKAQRQNKGSQ